MLQGHGGSANGQGEAANSHGSAVHQLWQDWQHLDAAAATAWLGQALEACERLAPATYFPAGQPLLRTVQQRRGQGTDGQADAQAAHAAQPTARSWEGALKALLVEWAGAGGPGATAAAAVLGLLHAGVDVQGEVRPARGLPALGAAHHGQAQMQRLAAVNSTGSSAGSKAAASLRCQTSCSVVAGQRSRDRPPHSSAAHAAAAPASG